VSVNAAPLTRQPNEATFDAADSGWYAADGVVTVKSGVLDVLQRKEFEIRLEAP
jgi:hypothetical protein